MISGPVLRGPDVSDCERQGRLFKVPKHAPQRCGCATLNHMSGDPPRLELPHAMHAALAQLVRDYAMRMGYGTAATAQTWAALLRDLLAMGADRGWRVAEGADPAAAVAGTPDVTGLLRTSQWYAGYTGGRPRQRCGPPPGERSLLVHTDPHEARRWLARSVNVSVSDVSAVPVLVDWDSAVLTPEGALVPSAEPLPETARGWGRLPSASHETEEDQS